MATNINILDREIHDQIVELMRQALGKSDRRKSDLIERGLSEHALRIGELTTEERVSIYKDVFERLVGEEVTEQFEEAIDSVIADRLNNHAES